MSPADFTSGVSTTHPSSGVRVRRPTDTVNRQTNRQMEFGQRLLRSGLCVRGYRQGCIGGGYTRVYAVYQTL